MFQIKYKIQIIIKNEQNYGKIILNKKRNYLNNDDNNYNYFKLDENNNRLFTSKSNVNFLENQLKKKNKKNIQYNNSEDSKIFCLIPTRENNFYEEKPNYKYNQKNNQINYELYN